MKITAKSKLQDLKFFWQEEFNGEKWHIALVKIFKHSEMFSNTEERMSIIKEVCEKNRLLRNSGYSMNGFTWQQRSKYYFTCIPYLLKQNILTSEERCYIIEYFLCNGDGIKNGLKDNSIGVSFKNADLNFDEMVKVVEFCMYNKVNLSYIDFTKTIRKYATFGNEKTGFVGLKKVFDAFTNKEILMKQFNNIYYSLRNAMGIGAIDFKEFLMCERTNNLAYKSNFIKEFINMITEIHTEKRFFNMLTTPLQKLHYLMLFSIPMNEQEQIEVLKLLMEKNKGIEKIITELRWKMDKWVTIHIDLKGEARDIAESLLLADKLIR